MRAQGILMTQESMIAALSSLGVWALRLRREMYMVTISSRAKRMVTGNKAG